MLFANFCKPDVSMQSKNTSLRPPMFFGTYTFANRIDICLKIILVKAFIVSIIQCSVREESPVISFDKIRPAASVSKSAVWK